MGKPARVLVRIVLYVVVPLIVLNLFITPLMEPKIARNDTAAIATIRNLGSVQSQFRDSRACDVDGDGIGEFGTLAEMTGTDGVRTDATGLLRGPSIHPPILSGALAAVNENGLVTKSGYCFRIFLPRKGGGGANEGKAQGWISRDSSRTATSPAPVGATAGTPLTGPVDIDSAEVSWCAYAWPVAYGNSGKPVFFVDREGEVWEMTNSGGRYSGVLAGPAWDAAMPADGKATWSPSPEAEEYTGRDGNVWKRTP